MGPIIGIDLGTINSAVAHLTDAGQEVIPNALGGRLTPSVVGVDEFGAVLVGPDERNWKAGRPFRAADGGFVDGRLHLPPPSLFLHNPRTAGVRGGFA